MFLDLDFPFTYAFGSSGGPRFLTGLATGASGFEAREPRWTLTRGAWEVTQENRTDAETEALIAFFRLVNGRAHGFRFRDFQPGESTGENEVLGVGDGATVAFQLQKWYTLGGNQYARRIVKPVIASVVCKLDGVATTAFMVDPTEGMVQFDVAPAVDVVVTASFTFDVPVRFDVDALQITGTEPGISTWSGITLVELRDTFLLDALAEEENSPSRKSPSAVPLLVSERVETVAGAVGSGYLSTHYLAVTLSWRPYVYPLEGPAGDVEHDPVAFTSLYVGFAPRAPLHLFGTFPGDTGTLTPTARFGDYQGSRAGVNFVRHYTPALDAFVYEEILRGEGHTYRAVYTKMSGRTLYSLALAVHHETFPPSTVRNLTATFHDAGEFFSYIGFTFEPPGSLHGNPVYFYFGEYRYDGGAWVPLGIGPAGPGPHDEVVVTEPPPYAGNTGFVGRFAGAAMTWQCRLLAQNDWGTSGWATSPVVTIPRYP